METKDRIIIGGGVVLFLIALIATMVVITKVLVSLVPESEISSFSECVAAGYPVMESYPRQCNAGSGRTFTENAEEPIIGGDRDEHGCLIPAGYGWNATAGKCMRPWSGEVQDESATAGGGQLCGECPRLVSPSPDWCANGSVIAGEVNECGCRGPPRCVRGSLSSDEAMAIARNSECTQAGLTSKLFYNNYTKTWWIDLNAEKQGCNPACVVWDNGTAEVNWRCTGLIIPELVEGGNETPLLGGDRDEHGCIGSAGYSWCEEEQKCIRPWEEECARGSEPITSAINNLAIDLYKRISEEDGNIFLSPFSISTALTMTYEGAAGKTAEEMEGVLRIPADDKTRRESFKEVLAGINKGSSDYEMSTANALWPQRGYPFLESYTNVIRQYYGGEATALDYVSETEKSRETINTWVEDKTRDKIKDIIPRGAITPLTRLVLTNAIYFKGKWLREFDNSSTTEQDFKVTPQETVKVRMMSQTGEKSRFKYAETKDLQILEMPYKGDEISMLILLPKGELDSLEKNLSAEKIAEWRSKLAERQVDVYVPKFKMDTKYSLPKTLSMLGMPTAFTPGEADFSGMDGSRNLYISDVIHQAFVEVNEEGTEAAAATAVIVALASAMPARTTFRADHPFIFIIQEKRTGNILFMGRLEKPAPTT